THDGGLHDIRQFRMLHLPAVLLKSILRSRMTAETSFVKSATAVCCREPSRTVEALMKAELRSSCGPMPKSRRHYPLIDSLSRSSYLLLHPLESDMRSGQFFLATRRCQCIWFRQRP